MLKWFDFDFNIWSFMWLGRVVSETPMKYCELLSKDTMQGNIFASRKWMQLESLKAIIRKCQAEINEKRNLK